MDGDIEDLLAYFQQQLILEDSWPKICLPEARMSQMHISGEVWFSLSADMVAKLTRWFRNDLDLFIEIIEPFFFFFKHGGTLLLTPVLRNEILITTVATTSTAATSTAAS